MPLPKPNIEESEEDFVARFMRDEVAKKEFPDHKQRLAVAYETYRDSKKRELTFSEPIPILRAFEKDGKRYVYGYAGIFTSADLFGTALTREVVESSVPYLQKFPAVRFMHKEPFGQINFNQEVDGVKTFVDDHGFHVLCDVYPERDEQWNMVQRGGWGFSYGLMPYPNGIERRKLADGKYYDCFVRGRLYEVSVVDTPAHEDAIAHVMRRFLHGDNVGKVTNSKEEKKMEKAEVEQMLKDSETRIMAAVTTALEGKKEERTVADELKAFEERVMATVNATIAKIPQQEDTVKKALDGFKGKIDGINTEISNVKGLMGQLEKIGEDTSSLQGRVKQLETAKNELMNTVERGMDKLGERLATVENEANEHSPASTGTKKTVQRSMGFKGMLDAAFGGDQ